MGRQHRQHRDVRHVHMEHRAESTLSIQRRSSFRFNPDTVVRDAFKKSVTHFRRRSTSDRGAPGSSPTFVSNAFTRSANSSFSPGMSSSALSPTRRRKSRGRFLERGEPLNSYPIWGELSLVRQVRGRVQRGSERENCLFEVYFLRKSQIVPNSKTRLNSPRRNLGSLAVSL